MGLHPRRSANLEQRTAFGGAMEPPTACATVLACMLLSVLLSHSGWASAADERCTAHSDCEIGHFCGKDNSTASNATCLLCSTMCSTPSAPTASTCNLPCTAVNGDCCTQQFKLSCQARQVYYTGPVIPCSLCDSAVVAVQTKGEVVEATLRPSVRMLRDLEAGLSPRTETTPCESFDETLVGNFTLRCVDNPPTLQGSAQNCTRRTYEATDGFRYSQDPSWQDDVPDAETECGGISLVSGFNPLISVGVDGVGRCHSANAFALWGREQFVGPDWVDGEHERWGSFCVDCDVETGYEGGTSILRLYRGTDCSPLSQSRQTHLTVDQCAYSSDRQVRYTATCDVNSLSQCPKPDGAAVQVSTHRSVNPQRAATCVSEPELLHAFAAENVGMDQCIAVSRNNTAAAIAYRSLRVCCSVSMIRIRYYTDQECSVHGDAGDDVEYPRGCNSITTGGSETVKHVEAVCSSRIPPHHCPPLNDVALAIVDNLETSDAQTETSLTTVGVIVIIAVVVAAVAAAGVTAAKFGGWNYRKTLFGESSTVAVERVIEPKEKTEKQKIFEQYRAMSNDDADKRTGSELSPTSDTNNMQSLPGSTTFDDDAEDPLAAARMATAAAAEDNMHMSRSKSRDHKNSVRSASRRDKRKQTDNGKLRSKSFAPRTSHSRNKEQRKSGSDGSRHKEQLKSASEGTRRKAVQHNLKEMKNLEGSKCELASGSHRGEAIGEGKLRSKSFAPHTSYSRNKEHRKSGSEGIDLDGSGTLDRNEIAMLATKMGRGLTSDELDAAMSAMDKDGNGTVEFDEFYTWYCGSSRAKGKAEVKVLAYLKRSQDAGSS